MTHWTPRLGALAAVAWAVAASGCDGAPAASDGDADGDMEQDAEVEGADGDGDADGDADAQADGSGDSGDSGDGGESDLCPPPPAGLPEVEARTDGRFVRLLAVPYPGLSPRDVTVYLPPSYAAAPGRRFPVLYMHDGQNLFHPEEAAFGVAWEVDDTLDALVAAGVVEEHIVVGVHNTAERIFDYTPDVDPGRDAGGGADLYADFLRDVLKPMVDSRFRTLCGRRNQALAGSSLGGLVSLHVAMRTPETFGRVAAVSPSLWWNGRSLLGRFERWTGALPLRLWIDAGSAEGEARELGLSSVVADCRDARAAALAHGMVLGEDLGYLEDPHAAHDEAAWAVRLPSILAFLLRDDEVGALAPASLSLFAYRGHLGLDPSPEATTVAVEALHGGLVRLTRSSDEVAFESLDPAVASVGTDGRVTAAGAGAASIEASFRGLSARAEVWVGPGGSAELSFVVTVPPGSPAGEAVHVTGSVPELGSWDPAGRAMTRLDASRFLLRVRLPLGLAVEYKYTRGSWATVEKRLDGSERPNRSAVADRDLLIADDVEAWADSF